MSLSDYIEEHGLTHAEMAERIDVTREYVTMLLSGSRVPGRNVAIRIERETKGKVPVNSWPSAAAA